MVRQNEGRDCEYDGGGYNKGDTGESRREGERGTAHDMRSKSSSSSCIEEGSQTSN
jgi:hypothetical protein